jgi:hypothetical protein
MIAGTSGERFFDFARGGVGKREDASPLILIETLEEDLPAILETDCVTMGIGFEAELRKGDKLGIGDAELLLQAGGNVFEDELRSGWNADGHEGFCIVVTVGRDGTRRFRGRGKAHGTAREPGADQSLSFRREAIGMSMQGIVAHDRDVPPNTKLR